jgi:hypothetical protein
MPDSNTSAWPSIVALAGIVVGALGAGYASWVSTNAQANIAQIHAQASLAEAKANHTWSVRASQCQQLSTVAENLAKSRADLFSNFDLKSRAAMEGYVWAGASYLTTDEQKPFLARYQQGASKTDEGGFTFVADLSSIVLKSLAEQAAICRQSLSNNKDGG